MPGSPLSPLMPGGPATPGGPAGPGAPGGPIICQPHIHDNLSIIESCTTTCIALNNSQLLQTYIYILQRESNPHLLRRSRCTRDIVRWWLVVIGCRIKWETETSHTWNVLMSECDRIHSNNYTHVYHGHHFIQVDDRRTRRRTRMQRTRTSRDDLYVKPLSWCDWINILSKRFHSSC